MTGASPIESNELLQEPAEWVASMTGTSPALRYTTRGKPRCGVTS